MMAAPAVAKGADARVLTPVTLGAILLVAALLRGWNLDDGGVLIPYYFAGVRNALQGLSRSTSRRSPFGCKP
jgi:hypothetical protein